MRWLSLTLRSLFGRRPATQARAVHLRDGAWGERMAEKYLKRHGHHILARNFLCPMGELDLVTRDGDTVVFVEVKSRQGADCQDPLETVTPVKWSRVERAARLFRAQQRLDDAPCRFDLVTVVWGTSGAPLIEHIESAFEPRRS